MSDADIVFAARWLIGDGLPDDLIDWLLGPYPFQAGALRSLEQAASAPDEADEEGS